VTKEKHIEISLKKEFDIYVENETDLDLDIEIEHLYNEIGVYIRKGGEAGE
jgi:hypothetical protein